MTDAEGAINVAPTLVLTTSFPVPFEGLKQRTPLQKVL